jgi:integrase
MAGKQAKILSSDSLNSLLAYASSSRHPLRNVVIVLLSAKAGLRAGEIANLTWAMVLDAGGEVSRTIALHDKAAKKGSGRSIPIHPQLAEALRAWAGQSRRDGHDKQLALVFEDRPERNKEYRAIYDVYSHYRRLENAKPELVSLRFADASKILPLQVDEVILLNARSKAASSSAPTASAVSMNRFDCSVSSGFGAGLRPIEI